MRAEVRRHRDRADVHRAARPDLGGPSLLIRGVARERRRGGRDRRRNIPEARHVSAHNSADEFRTGIVDARDRHGRPRGRDHQRDDRRRHLPGAGIGRRIARRGGAGCLCDLRDRDGADRHVHCRRRQARDADRGPVRLRRRHARPLRGIHLRRAVVDDRRVRDRRGVIGHGGQRRASCWGCPAGRRTRRFSSSRSGSGRGSTCAA